MELTIVTAASKQIIDVAWIEVNTPAGNFVIQTGHAPMIVTLVSQKEFIYQPTVGKQESLIVGQALLNVNRDTALLVLQK